MMAETIRLADYRCKRKFVFFSRHELNQLLSIYSRRIISGEWKAYAIDHRDGVALFSVFRHASARPVYTIAKFAANSHRNGDYLLTSAGRRLKRGESLAAVVAMFDRKLELVSNRA